MNINILKKSIPFDMAHGASFGSMSPPPLPPFPFLSPLTPSRSSKLYLERVHRNRGKTKIHQIAMKSPIYCSLNTSLCAGRGLENNGAE